VGRAGITAGERKIEILMLLDYCLSKDGSYVTGSWMGWPPNKSSPGLDITYLEGFWSLRADIGMVMRLFNSFWTSRGSSSGIISNLRDRPPLFSAALVSLFLAGGSFLVVVVVGEFFLGALAPPFFDSSALPKFWIYMLGPDVGASLI
jgi:hypothetical protein